MSKYGQYISIVSLALALSLVAACGGHRPTLTPEDPHWKDADDKDTPELEFKEGNLVWDALRRPTFDQATQGVDIYRNMAHLTGSGRQAWNINSYDELPNSSWYTNRHHLNPMSPEEIQRGYFQNGGPDTTGRWEVFRPKVGGVTPGFWIKDRNGDAYILKFDPPGYPELGTSTAAMSGRIFYACGYNVPEETIVSFHPDSLDIGSDVTYKDETGAKIPFTRETLNSILERVNIQDDGRVRCLASTLLPNVRGPFSFSGRRKDDPNDWCDHEHRRELRALRLFCAFVNHWDIKDDNSMNCQVEEDGRSFLRHYLMDFGTTMGSGGYRLQLPTRGHTNFFDINDVGFSFLTLGAKVWPWENPEPVFHPSVGYFEAETFKPQSWKPGYPLPAFENMTLRDGYWAAKVIMSLRDDDLRAVIAAGKLSDEGARDYMLRTLATRRDKIGEYYFKRINALEFFKLTGDISSLRIDFVDLSVKYGLVGSSESRYEVEHAGTELINDRPTDSPNHLFLSADDLLAIKESFDTRDGKDNIFELEIETRRDDGKWSNPVRLSLWYHPEEDRFQLVGIEHVE